jgi:transcriptional regulator with XRE-family HTH domain
MNMTQVEFAQAIGIEGGSVSMIERGKNPLTETNIRLICQTFGVCEDWLRTGSGEMFAPKDELAALDEDQREAIRISRGLSPADRKDWFNYGEFLLSKQTVSTPASSVVPQETAALQLQAAG